MGDNIKAAPIMKIRQYRGMLADSMETMKEIPATLAAVKEYIQAVCAAFPFTQTELNSVEVKPYSTTPDERIGWEQTYVVVYQPRDGKHRAIFAMCDQPVNT